MAAPDVEKCEVLQVEIWPGRSILHALLLATELLQQSVGGAGWHGYQFNLLNCELAETVGEITNSFNMVQCAEIPNYAVQTRWSPITAPENQPEADPKSSLPYTILCSKTKSQSIDSIIIRVKIRQLELVKHSIIITVVIRVVYMDTWSSQDVLITGGLGFTGSNLASQLVDQGANVTILDIVRSNEKLRSIRHIRDEVEVIDSDIRDSGTVAEAVKGMDVVYHLASKTSRHEANEKPRENLEINCRGPLNILEPAADSANPPHVIYASSLAVVGNVSETIDEDTMLNPVDIYGAHKGAVENYCRLYTRIKDVPTTAVRPANLYGPHAPLHATGYGIINQFVGEALRDETLSVFEPSDTREFLYIEDMVDALTRIAGDQTAFGERYILSTGRPLSMKRAAEMVVEIAGSGSTELVPWTESWEEIRRGDVSTDPSKIKEDLGWTTNISLEEGLKRTFEFYRENDQYR